MGKVYFIGGGPGDPKLITVKGSEIIKQADVIIYAGSLVNQELIELRKKGSKIYNSATMTLDEIIDIIKKSIKKKLIIARIHSGDPSIYGAIREQIDILEQNNIDFEIIPGVSSFTAAAAALRKEFTLPNVSQTIICTRLEGKTLVPKKESLELLAQHNCSMVIFLSIHMIEKIVEKLLLHYKKETLVAVIQRVTWDDQKIVLGNLDNISQKVKELNITKTALILVGDFLGNQYEKSKLYDKNFSHGYREGQKCGE